jgi:hypothetical protein
VGFRNKFSSKREGRELKKITYHVTAPAGARNPIKKARIRLSGLVQSFGVE